MGWDMPAIPDVQCSQPFSVCLGMGIAVSYALAVIIWMVSAGHFNTLFMMESIFPLLIIVIGMPLFTIIAGFFLTIEISDLYILFGRHLKANIQTRRQNWAHQYHYAIACVFLSPDKALLARINDESTENAPSSITVSPLFADDMREPGLARYEQLCEALLTPLHAEVTALPRDSHQGGLAVYVQTTHEVTEQELLIVKKLCRTLALPQPLMVHALPPEPPFEFFNQKLLNARTPSIVLALHYRQPDDDRPELAVGMLFIPAYSLKASEYGIYPQVFRAMPVNKERLHEELQELHAMAQQPDEAINLIWHSGLDALLSKKLNLAANELNLPLDKNIPLRGQLNFDTQYGSYGPLTSWFMLAATVTRSSATHQGQWIVAGSDRSLWAQTIGTKPPQRYDYYANFPDNVPYVNSMLFAMLANLTAAGAFFIHYPEYLTDWWAIGLALLEVCGISMGMLLGLIYGIRLKVESDSLYLY